MSDKIILNPVSNVQNVVDKDNLATVIRTTLNQVTRQLLDISGPYSRNALIMHDPRKLAETTGATVYGNGTKRAAFIRDGRQTVQQIQYASPIQRYIKDDIIDFVGERIDANCHDGTTSSMLFTSAFLMYFLQDRNKLEFVSNTSIEQAFAEVSDTVLEELAKTKITVATLLEDMKHTFEKEENYTPTELDARRILAYMQAYTSSSGNVAVAKAVAEVVAHTPVTEQGQNINYVSPRFETPETNVEAKCADFEFKCAGQIMTPQFCNTDYGTTYTAKNVDILVLRSGVTRDTMVSIGITNYLNAITPEHYKDRALVIMLPTDHGSTHDTFHFDQEILQIAIRKGIEVFIFGYQRPTGYDAPGYECYYVDGLSIKADVPLVTEVAISHREYITVRDFLIKDVDVFVTSQEIAIDRVIKWDIPEISEAEKFRLTKANIHPGTVFPAQYPYYTSGIEFFNARLIALTRGHEINEVTVTDLRRALGMLSCCRHWYVYITGKFHDQQAMIPVVEDAAGAANTAISTGLHFNGPIRLLQALNVVLSNELAKVEQADATKLVIIMSLMQAAKDMSYAMFGHHAKNLQNAPEEFTNSIADKYAYLNVYTDVKLVRKLDTQPFTYLYPDTKKDIRAVIVSATEERKAPLFITFLEDQLGFERTDPEFSVVVPPCQVGNMFDVLLNRIREATLRLVFTDNLIAPGTVWDDGTIAPKN